MSLDSKTCVIGVVDGSLPSPEGATVQMKDVHAAARKLPAQLDLKRMPHVVVNYDTERTGVAVPRWAWTPRATRVESSVVWLET